MYRRAILIITAIIISTSALFGMFPQAANADGTPSPYLADQVVKAATLSTERNSLGMCIGYDSGAAFKDSDYGYNVDPKNIANGTWFSDYTQIRQWSDYNNGDDGTNCDKFDVNKALSDLGWKSKIQAGCDMGLVRQKSGENCVNGSSNFTYKGGGKDNVLKAIDKVYKGGGYNGSQYYVMAMSVLLSSKACKASPIALASNATADQKAQQDATITVIGSDGISTKVLYKFGGDKGKEWSFRNGTGGDTDYVKYKCSELAGVANDNAAAYAKWVGQNPQGTETNPGTCAQYATVQMGGQSSGDTYDKMVAACTNGTQNKGADYCSKTYPTPKHIPNLPPEDQPQPFEQNACLYGQKYAKTSADSGSTDDPSDDDSKPTCSVEGIGWLVCPVMNFMAKINDMAYGFLASYFLSVDTGIVSGAMPAWEKFRDIANVAFVIAILFIVYSQITSVGISNYGIKRMLPRLIVAALLVNVSFWICALAVDLSNLLGYAIPQFFTSINIGGAVHDSGGALATVGEGLSWVVIIGGVLAAAVGVALAISVPVLLAALLAIGLVVLMLVGRQAFIVLLIVVSPLAFVAYLLPNTEQWFKKWYKMFFALLMLFPVVGAVFGASNLAANIINNAGGKSDHIITQIVALAVSAVPFFVVPSLLKGSLAATGALGAKLQGMANGAGKRVGARVKDSSRLGTGLADMKKYRDQQRAIKYAKGRGSGVMAGVGRLKGGKGYNDKARLRAESLENEEYENDVKAATENQSRHMSFEDKQKVAMGDPSIKASVAERDAAIRFMMQSGNFAQRQQVLASMGSMTMGQKHSAVGGARAKGDGNIYGNSNLGALEDAEEGALKNTDVQQALNDGAVNRINSGEISPETFTRDTYTSSYIANQAQHADAAAQNNLAQSLSDYAATDQGKKATFATQGDVQKVINAAPTTPTPPQTQAAQPQAQPTPQTPAGQLTIPHGGGNPPASPPPATPPASPPHQPPGTSNYTQRPSGLFVPPSSNTPPSNPPSNPPNP